MFRQPKRYSLFCILLLLLSMVGCTEKEPIRIGFIGGLSGRVADLGVAGRNGATLAVEQQNQAGPIRGRTLALITVDDRQDAGTGTAVFESLLQQDVAVVIGPMTSAMAVAMAPLANQNQKVTISPTANTIQLANQDDFFFRVISSSDYYGKHMAKYLFEQLKLRHVSIIYDLNNAAYTESYKDSFGEAFGRLGGTVSRSRPFHSGSDTSYFDLVNSAIGPETDGLFLLASSLDAALICQQADKIAPDLVIAGTGWSATEKLIEMGGVAVEGIYLQQYFDRDNTQPEYRAFREAYLQRFGVPPGFAAVASYDATNLAINSLKQADPGTALKQHILRTAEFEGIQQPIRINRFGDAERTPYLSTVRDGEFKVLQ